MNEETPEKTTRLRIAIILASVVIIGVGIWLMFGLAPSGPIPAGPMVQKLEPESFILVWKMPDNTKVTLRVKEEGGDVVFQDIVTGKDGRYEVRIDDLRPWTFYDYEIEGKDAAGQPAVLSSGRTRTAPAGRQDFRFIAFGDSGTGYRVQYKLAKLMSELDPMPELIIHTGDLIYPDGAAKHYVRNFYRPYADLMLRGAFYVCIGNHDTWDYQAKPLFDNFVFPENGPEDTMPEQYYWFDYGDVRFICLDSNDEVAIIRDKAAPWLDEVLADAGSRWKVLFYHHPVYTNGDHSPSGKLREFILPITDRHEVELILVGHNHMYERSHPMHNGEIAGPGRGVVHITTGAGGGNLQEIENPQPDFLVKADDSQYSFTVIDVTADKMLVEQIGLTTGRIDQFEIIRRGSLDNMPETEPAVHTGAGLP